MDNQSAIETIKNCAMPACEYHIKGRCERDYEQREKDFEDAKGAAVVALEKQIPKKPEKIPNEDGEFNRYFCPVCNRYFGNDKGRDEAFLFKETYCQNERCGQAIVWDD